MTATLKKLMAGDGYSYLTRQVARNDATTLPEQSLADYYSAKGETPGKWRGRGLAGLGVGPTFGVGVGSVVSEIQMAALFGEGLHPNADAISRLAVVDAIAAGMSPSTAKKKAVQAARLGRRFASAEGSAGAAPSALVAALKEAFEDRRVELGMGPAGVLPASETETLRTVVAARVFSDTFGREPLSASELSGFITRETRSEGHPVAGFDVSFSPVKSISTLWAAADLPTARVIEEVHDSAVAECISWIEDNAAFTRRGAGGVRQVETHGVMAAAFTHRDSRAGDPDLHTHVAISNKVQAVDGTWLALDGAALYEQVVAVSERYNAAMERLLQERLGVRFVDREVPGKRPIREIDGVPADLMEAWSSRRLAIEARTAELTSQFLERHLRMPTGKEHLKLAQQANLETREAKHEPRSYAEQRQQWRGEAIRVLGSEQALDRLTADVTHRGQGFIILDDGQVRLAAERAVAALEASRATFKRSHVEAEALRQVRVLGLSPADQITATPLIVEQALGGCVETTVEEFMPHTPAALLRSDGSSVYVRANSRSWSSPAVLRAEAAVIEAAARLDGMRLDDAEVDTAVAGSAAAGLTLSPSQEHMVRVFGTSGRAVELGLAPAGTGKTTAMKVLAEAWRSAGGEVMGLSPTAVAAANLGDSIDAPADTIASLTYALAQARAVPEWAATLPAGSLLLVDEAGMASTLHLERLVEYATVKRWKVCLLGDDQQLAAVAAGGVLRDIKDRFGAVTLTELRRFTDPKEGQATLDLRVGDDTALGFYFDHGRVHLVTDATAEHDLLQAWLSDREHGHESLMMASTNALVDRLNYLARAERVAVDGLTGPVLSLRRGMEVSQGDVIVTRLNDRRLRLSNTDWVKNSDRWRVLEVGPDKSLLVTHLNTGRSITLPPEYVAAHVDLGYASTVHGAQGMTVDRAHVLVTGTEARQQFYVAMSRAKQANHVYVVDPANSTDTHAEWLEEGVAPKTAREVLERIVARDGSAMSATSTRVAALDPARTLQASAARYQDAVAAAAEALLGADFGQGVTELAEAKLPGISTQPAWPSLVSSLGIYALDGEDLNALLDRAIRQGPVPATGDAAAVLQWRIARPDRPGAGPVPWFGPTPKALTYSREWGAYLGDRRRQLVDRITIVRANAQAWTAATAPSWAAPLMQAPELVADLAVWRAVNGVEDSDRRPAGPEPTGPLATQQYRRLLARVADTDPHHTTRTWAVVGDLVRTDPFWPVLARRLAAAEDTGVDVEQLLEAALERPLPSETPAASLWYRLWPDVATADAPDAARPIRLRPEWTSTITGALPEAVAAAFLDAPEWGDFVDQINTAKTAGLDVELFLRSALWGHLPRGADPAEQAALIRGRVLDLLTEEPTHVDVEDTHEPVEAVAVGEDEPDQVVVCDTPVERVLALTAAADSFYREQYPGSGAQRYITGRFRSDLQAEGIPVGYAPGGWDTLVRHLKQVEAATDQELVDAGLGRWTRRGQVVDLFRDRVMFGLRDPDGQLVGFTGRCAPGAPPETPKYVNTPATPAFTKGRVLFGLHENRAALEAGAIPVRVEGPMDAIAVTLAGEGHAVGVAPLGTALTGMQGRMIAEASSDGAVLSATDLDKAGQKAAARDYSTYTRLGLDPRELVLVNNVDEQPVKDPADAYRLDPGSLRMALALPAIAPSMAAQVIRQRLLDDPHLGENAHARVRAARDAGAVIAALTPERWFEEIDSAAAAIAHISGTPDAQDDYRETVFEATVGAAINWAPGRLGTEAPPETHDALQGLLETLQRLNRGKTDTNPAAADYDRYIEHLRDPEPPDPEGPGIE